MLAIHEIISLTLVYAVKTYVKISYYVNASAHAHGKVQNNNIIYILGWELYAKTHTFQT